MRSSVTMTWKMRSGLVLSAALAWAALAFDGPAAVAQESRQATGVKVGEVATSSAIVWVRRTAKSERRHDGLVQRGAGDPLGEFTFKAREVPEGVTVDQLEGSCPGAAGEVRLRYGTAADLANAKSTPWTAVSAENDFSHQFLLDDLEPATVYHYSSETRDASGKADAPLTGHFETAPEPDEYADVTFTVITGQAYKDLDNDDGFNMYPAMGKLAPKFIVPTGDTVYYDSENPRATTVDVARYHWHRMYSYPRHIAFHLAVPGYWEKDDHDSLSDDDWPTMNPEFMLPLTFPEGLAIFRQQVPMGEKTYRTYRWGKGLQVWLVEGRDFRSPNTMPDGPEKSIWGEEQKRWLKESLLASDADWKVLVSPTPIVGPDRTTKADNHSNATFAHEGNEFREWAATNLPDRFFICCGDRHWQYHSVHPEWGVHEFSCGPASDQHAGGSPGKDEEYHRFHRMQGGFLSVNAAKRNDRSTITFRLHGVDGTVNYRYERRLPVQ